MTTGITNNEDIINSLDIIKRIKDLMCGVADHTASEDEIQELHNLEELQKEAEPCAEDWLYAEQLIRYSYFKEFAQELADDLGCLDGLEIHKWPFTCIDWDQAARELQMDYTEVEFDGVTYFIR